MMITFRTLQESDFSLMLTWLNTPHVHAWWNQEVQWTLDLVKEKYTSYVSRYKLVDGQQKPIHAFIIEADHNPIGYIQLYNVYGFPRSKALSELPTNLAAFDMFIGDPTYLGRGIGSQALTLFLNTFAKNYDAVFADPAINNIAAIKTYEKAGFKKIQEHMDTGEVWMIRNFLKMAGV